MTVQPGYYEMGVRLSSENIDTLSKFSQQEHSVQEAHRVLTDMVVEVRQVRDPHIDGALLTQGWRDKLAFWIPIIMQASGTNT